MAVVVIVVASLIALVGWALSVVGISGTWLILIAGVGLDLLVDGTWDFLWTTILFGLLCGAAEVVEFFSGLLGAKVFGGTRASQVGSFAGTLVGGFAATGLVPIPLVGTLIGIILGGFLGALLGELYAQRKLANKQAETLAGSPDAANDRRIDLAEGGGEASIPGGNGPSDAEEGQAHAKDAQTAGAEEQTSAAEGQTAESMALEARRARRAARKQGAKAGLKAGVGAMLARIAAIAVKITLATVMIVWFVVLAWSNAS